MREAMAGRLVGTKVARVEDPRLLTGTGRYVDDVTVPGMLHAHFVRSPFAHAVIRGIDVDAARRLPGVVAVYTGADIEALTHPFMGFLAAPGPLPPRVLRPRRRPRARRRRSGRADHRRAPATWRRTPPSSWSSTTRSSTPIATIEHALDPSRPAIWPAPGGNVMQRDRRDVRRRRRRLPRRRPRRTGEVRPAPLLQPADGDALAAWPRSTRWRARCSTTRPRRTPTS